MQTRPTGWNDVRGKGFFVAVFIASAVNFLAHALYTSLTAKIPGETHCYSGVCHYVYDYDETRKMIGKPTDLVATHYDWPGVDKYNTGDYTSSGEAFDADNPSRISASNFPDGTELLLWHPGTRRAVHVRVNDFGPFKGNRTLDVTRGAAEAMGWAKNGVATLKTTVIWVPPNTHQRYRRGRVFPASMGLIGVVEPHQYNALAEVLIATGPARNGQGSGPAVPDVKGLLAALRAPAPSFRSEGVDEADERAEETAAALAAFSASLPPLAVSTTPYVDAVYTAAPRFRVEAIADAAHSSDAVAVAAFVKSLPAPTITAAVPADLLPPVAKPQVPAPIVVAIATPAPVAPTVQSPEVAPPATAATPAPVPAPPALETAVGSVASAPSIPSSLPSEGSATAGNRSSSVRLNIPASSRQDESLPTEAPSSTAVVASARVPSVQRSWMTEPGVLLIGIGLMLTSLWGASSLGRSRQARRVAEVDVPAAAHSAAHDPLDAARRAKGQAVEHARSTLERAQQKQPANAAEADLRDELSRELALRDLEREQEASMRARADAAAAAHAAAQRELAALESARAERSRLARTPAKPVYAAKPPVAAAKAAAPVVKAAAPVPTPRIEPPRALADDAEMARFPGLTDRKLVGALVGLPGATGYWGNTIIAQMSLEGSAKSGSPMRVDGRIDGACTAPVLYISETATVSGVIAAETVVILGKVTGVVSGRQVIVAETAQVEGEVFYQTIAIDPKAHCDVSFRRLPGDQDPVALGSSVYKARAA